MSIMVSDRDDSDSVTADVLQPSAQAMLDLEQPAYLQGCSVVGRTTICDATIIYEVVIGDWIVWCRRGVFGRDDAHRAAGAAFIELARQQEDQMHAWADKVLAARAQQ